MKALCECIHKALQGFWVRPPLVQVKHLSTQRDPRDDRRSRNVRRRIEGEVGTGRGGGVDPWDPAVGWE